MNPSLLLIPDRYKKDKLYSQIPDSGAGDLTFARNSDATRVNSAGLIEKVRENLILQSEAFNTTWLTNASPTITANTTVAPDGTTTGDTIAASGANSGAYQAITVASGVEHSFSVYIKNISGATDVLLGCDLNPINAIINFNASTGAIISTGAGITGSSVTNAGNGWYRVAGTYVSTGTSNTFVVFGTGVMSFAAWGAQLETGVTTDYIPTTTAAVSVGITADIPRLDYTGGGCPSLLLEPQRTNTALYSEQFNNAFWIKEFATISANTTATLDPTGYYGADKLQEDNTTNSHVLGNNDVFAGSGQAVTFSVFLKSAERSFAAIRLYTGSSSVFGYYNLANGTLGTIDAGGTGTIVSYGNGWYRCSLTITMASSSITLPYVFTSTGDGVNSYTGVTGNGIYCFGAQQEVGSYATSYIPTLGSSVTRLADVASKTGISSLIGQTAGTLYIELIIDKRVNLSGTGPNGLEITDASSDNVISIGMGYSTDQVFLLGFRNAGSFTTLSSTINNALGTYKLAASYSSAGFAFYLNGVQVGTGATLPPVATFANIGLMQVFGSNNVQGELVSAAAIYPLALSNSELATLTTI
jgi:hypothetical protein